jgi:hypothetical protein
VARRVARARALRALGLRLTPTALIPSPLTPTPRQARLAAGKVDRLRHVLATARVLLSIRSEAEVVEVHAPAPT